MSVDIWRSLFRQMRSLGKLMVEDDIHDLGLFDYYNRKGHIDHPSKLHHWQLGVGIWFLSEWLSLLNFFVPFEQQIKKAQLKQQIKLLEYLQNRGENAKSKNAYGNKQNPFRGIGKRHSQVYG